MKSVDPGILDKSVCFSFTPSDLARELFFYPTWCGHYYCTSKYYMKRDYYDPLLLVYVKNGLFHIEYREHVFDAEKGDVVLLDCREPHYYHARNGLEFLYMHFDGSNSHELCQHILSQTGPLIRQENNVLIGRLLQDMVEFYEREGIESMMESSARIYQALEYLIDPPERRPENDTPIQKTIRYIQSHVGDAITLDELSEMANLSTYYFAHRFKEQTGFSPLEYVINTRIDQAKVLLARTPDNIEEIADKVGYSSGSSLINTFKKREGMSPSQYRRLMLGKV